MPSPITPFRAHPSIRRHRLVALGLSVSAAVVAALFQIRPADACSTALISIERSYPVAGARDVPTNAVLFAQGSGLVGSELRLARDDGTWVDFELVPVEPTGFDLRPLLELEPNRGYVLSAVSDDRAVGNAIEFATGAGPAIVPATLLLRGG